MMPDPKPWYRPNVLMQQLGFSPERARRAYIWSARDHKCPKCGAEPYQPCRNLNGIKNLGFKDARENRWPHVERTDYERLTRVLQNWRW